MIKVMHEQVKLPMSEEKIDQSYYLDFDANPIVIHPAYAYVDN